MRVAPLACAALALTAAAAFAADPETEGPRDRMELARRVSRSLWALVPDPSGDTGQERVTGSAVALGPGRLLAACGALGRRTEVALRRHEERRTARVAGSDPTGQACLLAVPDDAPLDPPQGVRDPAGLRPGEAVYAVYNETVDEGVLVEGRLEDARGGLLRASLGLPGGVGGAVLFDADGNLVGVGAADPREAGTAWAVPPERAAAPDLAVVPVEPLATSEPAAERDAGSDRVADSGWAVTDARAPAHEGGKAVLLRFDFDRRSPDRRRGRGEDGREGTHGDARPGKGDGVVTSRSGGSGQSDESDQHGDRNATGVADQGNGADGNGSASENAGGSRSGGTGAAAAVVGAATAALPATAAGAAAGAAPAPRAAGTGDRAAGPGTRRLRRGGSGNGSGSGGSGGGNSGGGNSGGGSGSSGSR